MMTASTSAGSERNNYRSIVLYKKFKIEWAVIRDVVSDVQQNSAVYTNTVHTINTACRIAEVYKLSFYDALIIASALELQCATLYSEDMQNGFVVGNKLTIVNPFL